jgi:putative aldouronate transport system permease protein
VFKEKIPQGMVGSKTVGSRIADTIIIMFLAGLMFVCFVPMWHVLMASFSDGRDLLANEGLLFLPVGAVTLDGYRHVFADLNILWGYANTIMYVLGTVAFGMSINIMGGYVLYRGIRIKNIVIPLILFTLLFSGGLVPSYMINRMLGFVGSRWAMIIPGCTNAIFVVLMMNAFRGVPSSTVEAAEIDGAGHVRTMLQVVLPQTRGLSIVVLLNTVIMQWNSWFPAAIYLPNARDKWPLQLWIRQITAENMGFLLSSRPDYSRYLIQFAVIVIATVPLLIAFPFFQRKLEAGSITGGVKE